MKGVASRIKQPKGAPVEITRTCEDGPTPAKRDFAKLIEDPEVGVTLGSRVAQRPHEVLEGQRQGVGVREMGRPPATGCEDGGRSTGPRSLGGF